MIGCLLIVFWICLIGIRVSLDLSISELLDVWIIGFRSTYFLDFGIAGQPASCQDLMDQDLDVLASHGSMPHLEEESDDVMSSSAEPTCFERNITNKENGLVAKGDGG